jgi:hypothetical protein
MVDINRSYVWSSQVDPLVIRMSDVQGDIEQTAKIEVELEPATDDITALRVAKVNANIQRCGFLVLHTQHRRIRCGGQAGDKVVLEFHVFGHNVCLMDSHYVLRQDVPKIVGGTASSRKKVSVEEGETQQRMKKLPPEQQDMQW